MTWWKAPDGRRWNSDAFSSVYTEQDGDEYAVLGNGRGLFGPVVLASGLSTQAEADATADSIIGGSNG